MTGDLDVFATNHTVTIKGGGSTGANATTITAAGLNASTSRDRVFHIISGGFAVTFSDLVIADGKAVDDGTGGTSSVEGSQLTEGTGGGILNNGSTLTLTNVIVKNCRAIGRGDRIVNEHTTLDARGGGLASVSASANATITDSKFTGDSATGGNGLIFNNAAGSGAQ